MLHRTVGDKGRLKIKTFPVTESKIRISVFVTRNRRFRAIVTEGKLKTEMTVYGEQWQAGKLKEHHNEIEKKCSELLQTLTQKFLMRKV